MSNTPPTPLEKFFQKDVAYPAGTVLPSQPSITFAGTGVSCADDPDNDTTVVTITAGGFSGQGSIPLSNGLNSNIATAGSPTLRFTGPTAAFSIGGLALAASADPEPGSVIFAKNTTTQPMTIVDEDVSSTAMYRITTPTGYPVKVPVGGAAVFVYDGTASRWVLHELFASPRDVNAADFGLDATDTVDCTTPLNNALTYAAALGAGASVYLGAGSYNILGTVVIPAGVELRLDAAALLHRHTGGSTAPVVRLGGNYAALTGKGTVQCDGASPLGIVQVGGPAMLTDTLVMSFAKIAEGVRIQGASTGGVNAGTAITGVTYGAGGITIATSGTLPANGSVVIVEGVAGATYANNAWVVQNASGGSFGLVGSPTTGPAYSSGGFFGGNVGVACFSGESRATGGANYNGQISDVNVKAVDTGIFKVDDVNGWHQDRVFFNQISRYCYRDVNNGESSTHGGFTTASPNLVAVIQEEGGQYNHFYGVQAEPGGGAYFNILTTWAYAATATQASAWVTIFGHNNCSTASLDEGNQSIIVCNGAGTTASGSGGSFILGNGNVILPPVALDAGDPNAYFTVKVDGSTTKFAQLGPVYGGSDGALYLGNIVPTAINYSFRSDGASYSIVNAPGTTGIVYLRINDTTVASLRTNGTQEGIRLDSGYLFGGTAAPSATNPVIQADGATYAVFNAPASGTGYLRIGLSATVIQWTASLVTINQPLDLEGQTTAATASTGSSGAPPAQVAGYLDVKINGSNVKVPYYLP